jgi:hypothetical protein
LGRKSAPTSAVERKLRNASASVGYSSLLVSGAALGLLREEKFGVVIIDEAS